MKIIFSNITALNKRKLFLCFLMSLMLLGIVTGVILVMTGSLKSYFVKPIFSQYLYDEYIQKSLLNIFYTSFISLESIVIFQLLTGFFAMGQPLCILTLFKRGVAGGISASLIYMQHEAKGFLIILIFVFPVLFFNMYILVLGARESIRSSNNLVFILSGKSSENNIEIKLYFLKFLVLTFLAVICSLIESLATYFFAKIFI
ncbi:MAG: hypothetical protein NC320_04480 [Clostridium sp.]|nr:hypothetical protein [Clostridium sp.]